MLAAEEKRWLVVGISLSKVLTPVLQNVVEKEMHQLYQRLILPPTSIQSQTFSSHLEDLSPSTMRLNYVNINNNRDESSRHNYDYGIRDEVSLAKLFVQPIMANFTAFDESLDLSAALSILCSAPNFVFSGVDIIAKEVRIKVRNEWGHCKFAMWTETYYNRCFELLENLIKSLDLSAPMESETKILEDLKVWKRRGKATWFEQQIDDDKLALFQNEMVTLLTSVEANKETWKQDHEGLRSHLLKFKHLFGLEIERLAAKHEALESGFESLKEDHLKMKESVIENVTATSSNACLIRNIKETFTEEQKGLQTRHEVLEQKVVGLSQGMDKLITKGNLFFKSGLKWKIPAVFVFSFLFIFLYEHYTKGSMLRYWYCHRGSLQGGRTLSFVFTTHDHQTPTVYGVEFSWENLKQKLNLAFDPSDTPEVHYYLNIHRCAYGGVIPVRSLLDGTPQVRGAEVFAVNSDCKQVFYEEGGTWKPYISARDIKCTRTKRN